MKKLIAAEYEAEMEHIEDMHLDLQGENEELRKALRRALKIEDRPRPPRILPHYRSRGKAPRRWIVIPDTQVRAGVPTEHLTAAGNYIAEKRPDVIVHLGDHFDFPSLSVHVSDVQKAFSGADYSADLRAANDAMDLLTKPYRSIKGYHPEEHYAEGNHCSHPARFVESFPFLRGVVNPADRNLHGWNVHPFLEPFMLDDILIAHFFAAPLSGRPIGGTAHNLLRHVGRSCLQGHRQVLDCALQELPDGTQRRATIAGAFYSHKEPYKGPQGNGHFRGILMLNEVFEGMWDQCEVSIEFLVRKYL